MTYLPNRDLELRLAGAYLDARFTKFYTLDPDNPAAGTENLKGNQPQRSPKWTATPSVRYTHSLTQNADASVYLEYAWKDDFSFSVFNTPGIDQRAYGLLNARIEAKDRDGKWNVALWGRNLANKFYNQEEIRNTAFVGTIAFPADPRTFGVTFGYRWQ